MKDDPTKPLKAIAGLIVAPLSYALAENLFSSPWDLVVTAIVTGLGVFLVPSPKVNK